MTLGLILALGATVAQVATQDPELRVRQTVGGPRLFRDGRMIRPRFNYVTFGTGAMPIGTEWTKVELPFVLPRTFARLQIQMRFPQPSETGDVSLRGVSIRRADGKSLACVINGSFDSDAAFAKTWRQTVGVGGGPALYLPQNCDRAMEAVNEHPFPSAYADGVWTTTLSPWNDKKRPPDYTLVSSYFGLEEGVEYVLSYEARSAVVDSVLPSLYVVSEDETRQTSIPMGVDFPAVATAKKAAAVGVDPTLYCPPPHRYPEGEDWRWNDLYCDRLIRANPNILLIPRVSVNAPEWWLKAHPDARMRNEKGTWLSQSSVASREYRDDALAYLTRFIRHMREKYGKNFGGIQPVGQTTSEWFYQGSQVWLSGYDPSTRDAYRRWRKAKGRADWETAEVPSPERRRTKVEGTPLLDPIGQADVIDFNRFLQDDLTDFLGEVFALCRRETQGRKLVFSFYGYVNDFACNGPSPAATGHYGLQRLLDRSAADMDMMCAPISYVNRGWTGVSMNMSAPETVERAGVMWFDENDARTYLARPSMADSGPGLCLQTKEKTLDVLRRDTSREILRNIGSWWMDLQGRGWWNDEAIWRIIPDTEAIERKMMARTRPFAPEIALILDEESLLHVGANTVRQLAGLVHFRRGLSYLGAPFGQYLLSDVVRNGLDAKFQIYMATWFAKAPPAKEGVTRLFVQVPGAPEPSGLGPNDIVLPLSDLNMDRPEKLYDLAKRAGVRLFLDRSEIGKAVVWASGDFVTMQAIGDGFRDFRKGECRFFTDSPATTMEFIAVDADVPAGVDGISDTAAFVKTFETKGEVKSARWTVSGLGVFRAYVNGREVGTEDFLKPGLTHVGKRRHSFAYDVTSFLKDGKNVLAAEVSASWWRDQVVSNPYVTKAKESGFGGELEITYADGAKETVATGTDWRAAYGANLTHAEIYWGETYDARVDASWRTTGDVDWKPAKAYAAFQGVVTPVEGQTIRIRRDLTLKPREIYVWKGADGATDDAYGKVKVLRRYADGDAIELNPGETLVVDFGQNAAGVPEITAEAAAGVQLIGHPAEMLNDMNGEKARGNDGPAGSAYIANYRTCRTVLTYVFAGKGEETYHPSFTFFGGRYFSYTATGKVTFRSIAFLSVMSIAPEDETGTITTGSADLNKLISNCIWGMRSNYLSVPTDCPQRNERLGWAGDTQAFCGAAVYAADVYGFLSKWMTDMRDTQMGDGDKFPGSFRRVAPAGPAGVLGYMIGWSDAGVIVPYTLWKQYGDTAVVKANWEAMKRFLALLRKTDYVTPPEEDQCADWLSAERYEKWRIDYGKGLRPDETRGDMRAYWDILGLCYRIWDLRMMIEMAEAVGETASAESWRAEESDAVWSFREKFLGTDGLLPERYRDMQTPAAFLLKLGLCPNAEATEKTKAMLKESFVRNGYRLQTGFLGTSILMDVLADAMGDPELAYSVLLQHGCPGWLYSVDQGATTIWERWDGYTKEKGFGPVAMNSYNHYAYGAVMGWMYRTMAGIRPGEKGGYGKFVLAPKPDRRIGSCAATYRTKYGTIESAWKYDEKGAWTWRFAVPKGTSATVRLPSGDEFECGPGEHEVHGTGAKFISPAEKREGHTVASFFRSLAANPKAVRKATLSATALGVFEVEVNGTKVGSDFLKPGFTSCERCRHVYTYDVTGLMKTAKGAENSILAQVAPTWWCDQINTAKKPTPWQLGKEVAFRCGLHLEYEDGTSAFFGSDTDWLASYSARTQTAGLYEGEVYDSRESIDWLKPAKVNTEFRGELRPATAKIALREDLALEPKAIYVTCGAEGATADAYGRAKVVRRYRDGEKIALNPGEQLVVDFGQNCSAVPSFQFDGRPGTQLEIRHAEMLNESNGEKCRGNDGPAGTPYLASLRSAYAGIRYTFAGGGDTYRPSFTFFGYRYLGVTTTAPVTFQRIRSVPVSSITEEMERGAITTGDARVNRLIENIRWGMLSNYLSVPTDCPQRDERLGWTADTQVFMNSAAYLADTWEFLRKYLADLRDGQYDDGLYTCFVPNVRHVFPHWASCGWTDAGVLIPYRLWKWYGRTEILDECWDSMERYMGFLERNEKPYRINHADWLAYEHKDTRPGADNRAQDPVYKEVMNAYFRLWMVRLMRDMARATGRLGRAAHYARQDYFLKMAFDLDYLAPDGTIKDYWKGQCSDLYMLKLGLCGNAAAVEATKKDLIDNIRAHGNRLQTGFLGTAILMPTLTFEANAPDVAYDLLFQDQDPSWLYSVDQGATTVWERWNSYTKEKGFGPTSMNSFNHYAYGCVLEWLFSAAAGIRPDPNQAGWKHFTLQPFADRRLGHLEATYDSPVGRITSAWKYDADGKLHWSFSIPEGATATVIAPDGTTREYAGGAYEL